MSQPTIYSAQQVADALSTTVDAIYKHVHRGHVTPQRFGRNYMFTAADLETLRARMARPFGRPPGSTGRKKTSKKVSG